jgi:tRNA pseudouridine(55) synthase
MDEYKDVGITCNDFIKNMKEKYKKNKIAYTARLDPMARGIIPLLFGDDCKKLDKMTKMNKKYRVIVICGIKTDSDDTLGIVNNINIVNDIDKFINDNRNILECSNITINQKFHFFSTKSLNKRRKGDYSDSYHTVELFSSKIIKWGLIKYDEWRDNLITTISKVDPNYNNRFRQNEIIEGWKNINLNMLPYFELELDVSSGFFVRQYISDFNMDLMCYDINRILIY